LNDVGRIRRSRAHSHDADGRFDRQKDEIVEGGRMTAGRVEALSGTGGSYVLRNLPAGKIGILAHTPGALKVARLA
jgi:hypothetical protein